jgi:hypothetical protein
MAMNLFMCLNLTQTNQVVMIPPFCIAYIYIYREREREREGQIKGEH